MKEINKKEELLLIRGGAKLSGTYINAIVGAVKIIFEIGKAFGSSIRRSTSGKLCELK